MDINNILGGSTGASLVESLYGANAKTNSTEEPKKANTSFFGEDSVSISDEAWEKLTAMFAEKSEEENAQSQNDAQSENNAGNGGVSGGGSSNDNESKTQSLQSKLAALQARLGSASASEAAVITAQINQITAEIAALQAEAA